MLSIWDIGYGGFGQKLSHFNATSPGYRQVSKLFVFDPVPHVFLAFDGLLVGDGNAFETRDAGLGSKQYRCVCVCVCVVHNGLAESTCCTFVNHGSDCL